MKVNENDITRFLDFLADAVLIVDENSSLVFANKSCAELFGYQREELLALTLSDLMTSNQITGHSGKVRNFIGNHSQARPMMNRGILPCRKANGDAFSARISIANIHFQDRPCGIATIQDYSTVQELIDELKGEASTDSLTNLFNKRHLENVIQRECVTIHDSGCTGVAYLDLNGFKSINDTFGHEAGDQLLVELSGRLTSKMRSGDICFRLGGDEFLILFSISEQFQSESEARSVGRKIHELISKPVFIESLDSAVTVGVSIGIGLFPHDGNKLSEVIKKADKAMYKSKIYGRKYVRVSQADDCELVNGIPEE